MRILSVADQKRILTMREAMDAVALALTEYSAGRADSPVRIGLPVPGARGTSLFMPALVEGAGGLGVKFVSVFPQNKEIGKQTIYGVLVLADPATAEPIALVEASYLTALRTGAASALATRYLARHDSTSVALIGTGGQASMQLRGVMAVRQIREVRLFNRHPDKAYRFARALTEELGADAPHFIISLTAEDAVRGADIVITATNSVEPVFPRGLIGQGVHINAIGSFRPHMQELPPGVIHPSAKVVVESRAVAMEETGDLVIPMRDGIFKPEEIYAELGEIAAGKRKGREQPDEVTIFKSVGLAAMDMVVGRAMYDRAVALELGTEVTLD